MTEATVGLLGIGLDTYWSQFPGLHNRLSTYVETVATKISAAGVVVSNAGLIDTVDKAFAANQLFRAADVELIFVYATTYALSSTVLPAVRRANVPVVILNLQPEAAIDYGAFNKLGDRTHMTGEWLAYCGACPVPEIANVLKRSGIPFHQVTGVLTGDGHVDAEIAGWAAAARAAHIMRHNRLGLLGRYYGGMLDIYTDQTLQLATFGGHIEMLEIDELVAVRRDVANDDIARRVDLFRQQFDVQADCLKHELHRAASTSLALDTLVETHRLGSVAYYHEGAAEHEHQDVISSVILGSSLLTARGCPVAGEYEIKNVQAMKILDALGRGGSFTEYYAVDFDDDVVLMGHDGPGHIAIAEGKTKVRSLDVYHGKPGRGLSVEMSVKHGPVTLLSVIERGDSLALLYAEGASVPGPILKIGNTNSRYRFPLGARGFIEAWNAEGPAHHCAIGVSHCGAAISKLAHLVGIEAIKVC